MCAYPVELVTQPSLFVGLGKAGIRCLELIQRRLPSDSVIGARLLGIRMVGAQDANHADETELEDENLLILNWDREQALRLAENNTGYEWWLNSQGNVNIERLDARMAFHIMKYFYRDNRLRDRMTLASQALKVNDSNPLMLYVIASLREPESAFLGDIIHEVLQQFGSKQVSVRLPCLLVDSNEKKISKDSSWISAALREVERFTQKGQILHEMSNEALLLDELFSHILLLDDEGYLPVLADQLTALMEKKTAIEFSNNFGNLKSPPRFSMTVSRSFTFLLPIEEIRRVCAARLLKEELMETKYFTESKLHALVSNFLKGTETPRLEWKFFRLLAEVLDGRKLNDQDKLDFTRDKSLIEIFNAELGAFLNLKFQGMLKDSNFQGTLKDKENFLKTLEADLSAAIDECARMGGWYEGMKQNLPQFRRSINDFASEVARWMQIWNSLKIIIDQRYKQISIELHSLKKDTENRHVILRETAEPSDYNSIENSYYLDLKKQAEAWQVLVGNTRKLITWNWIITTGRKPHLSCLIDNKVYTEAENMLPPLWKQASQLTNRLADFESVFDYLGQLSNQDVTRAFTNAPPSLKYDPHPAVERNSHEYLVCANNPMIHDWRMNHTLQHCQINDRKRLTYLRFDHNLPINGAFCLEKITKKVTRKTESNPDAAFSFPHEQYAWKIEQRMMEKNMYSRNFPAQLVRLMHKHDDFEIAMWCVFWDWIFVQPSGWCLKIGQENDLIPLGFEKFPALNIEDALLNFLLRLPLQDMSGLHALSKENFPITMALLRKKNEENFSLSRAKRAEFYDSVRNRIQIWQSSQKPFDQGLALYQTYLLAEDKNRRRK